MNPEFVLRTLTKDTNVKKLLIMKTKLSIQVRLRIEVGSTKRILVKAHTRMINGKVVKVRSHYRNI